MYQQLSASTRPMRPTGCLRRGFTLVELLVVITIIAMLVGLLIPAVQAARNAARKSQCMNNQRNLGLAVINYATTKEKFPPAFSVQPVVGAPATRTAVGWVPPILPNIEQNELYRAFQNNTWTTIPTAQVEVLTCPMGNQSSSPAPLSYVVNAGAQDQTTSAMFPADFQENGVFFDEFSPKFSPLPTKPRATPPTDLAYLSNHDGTKNTIMLSENLDARDWIQLRPGPPGLTDPLQLDTTGRSWWNTITWQQPGTGAMYGPDWGVAVAPTGTVLNKPSTSAALTDFALGRPYSNHSGGFMVTFCDGHTQFVSEDIQYRVYCLLMSPDSANVKYTRNGTLGAPVTFPNGWKSAGNLIPLTDTDIQ